MPPWNKAALVQLKQKILDGTVPTNPVELTNDYLYGTLSAIIFPDYHLTGPSGKASVIRRFRTAFDNIQLENEVAGARREGKTIFSLLESVLVRIFRRIYSRISSPTGTFDDDEEEEYDLEEVEEYDLEEEEEEEEMARATAAGRVVLTQLSFVENPLFQVDYDDV